MCFLYASVDKSITRVTVPSLICASRILISEVALEVLPFSKSICKSSITNTAFVLDGLSFCNKAVIFCPTSASEEICAKIFGVFKLTRAV